MNVAVETGHYYEFPNLPLVMPLLKQNKCYQIIQARVVRALLSKVLREIATRVSIEELAPGWTLGLLKKRGK